MSNPSSKKKLLDIITIFLGGAFLLGLVLASWLPPSCSLVKRHVIGCPSSIPPQTEAQKELGRIPHQDLTTGLGTFATKASTHLTTTKVHFSFRADYANQTAWLELKTLQGMQVIALVTHPLLASIDWPKITTTDPALSLYQRNDPAFASLEDFRAHLPAAAQIAADTPAAQAFGLKDGQYTALDKLSSLDNINYILTTFSPLQVDGTWREYSDTFDISHNALVENDQIHWAIYAPVNSSQSEPFRLGEVHIDYQEGRQ